MGDKDGDYSYDPIGLPEDRSKVGGGVYPFRILAVSNRNISG